MHSNLICERFTTTAIALLVMYNGHSVRKIFVFILGVKSFFTESSRIMLVISLFLYFCVHRWWHQSIYMMKEKMKKCLMMNGLKQARK